MTGSDPTGRRILVVDDDQGARLLTRLALEHWGLGVIEAGDGVQAVDLCRRSRPDAVLLDARMPRMNGFVACAAMRCLPGAGSLPIVMVTGLERPEFVVRAYRAGATDFVVKPVEWKGLGPRLEFVLAAAGPLAALRAAERDAGAPVGALPDLLLELDPAGGILAVADAAAFRQTHRDRPVAGQSLLDWLPPEPAAAALAQVRAGGAIASLDLPCGPGRRWVRLIGGDGRVIGVVRHLAGPVLTL